MREKKKRFYKLDFENCNLEYDSAIISLEEIVDCIEVANLEEARDRQIIHITAIYMTDKQYEKWQKKLC